MTKTLVRIGALAVVFYCGALIAQTVRVNVQLHQVIVTVTDDRGEYVSDLGPEDFTLEVNGAPHKIDLFRQDADTPITLGLLIDTSASMDVFFDATRKAAKAFINSFRPSDEFFVATFAHSLDVRQGLTQDKAKLADSLSNLRVARGDTHLLSSVLGATKLLRQGKNRKRALIVITDGMDTTCAKNLQSFEEGLRSSEALVYGIQMPASFSGPNLATVQILKRCPNAPGANDFFPTLVNDTGARVFPTRPHAPHFDDELDGIFETIQMELRGQYTLGFYSDDPVSKAGDAIRIRTSHSGYHIRTSAPMTP
jgi:Ca-activated chloride channel family protein